MGFCWRREAVDQRGNFTAYCSFQGFLHLIYSPPDLLVAVKARDNGPLKVFKGIVKFKKGHFYRI